MRNRPSGRRLPAALLAALLAALTMAVFAAPASAVTSATEAENLIISWMNRDRSAIGLRPCITTTTWPSSPAAARRGWLGRTS